MCLVDLTNSDHCWPTLRLDFGIMVQSRIAVHIKRHQTPRLPKDAVELNKLVLLLNIGPTQADYVLKENMMEVKGGDVLCGVVYLASQNYAVSIQPHKWVDDLPCVAFHYFHIPLLYSVHLGGALGGS